MKRSNENSDNAAALPDAKRSVFSTGPPQQVSNKPDFATANGHLDSSVQPQPAARKSDASSIHLQNPNSEVKIPQQSVPSESNLPAGTAENAPDQFVSSKLPTLNSEFTNIQKAPEKTVISVIQKKPKAEGIVAPETAKKDTPKVSVAIDIAKPTTSTEFRGTVGNVAASGTEKAATSKRTKVESKASSRRVSTQSTPPPGVVAANASTRQSNKAPVAVGGANQVQGQTPVVEQPHAIGQAPQFLTFGPQRLEGTPVLIKTNVPPGAEHQRQLKVEDALAYLDRVKMRFGNQPQVYNRFLEIMKNFKAQTIDTPGVIERVSDLFRGHNQLILGFNTFLPPGFKIEIGHSGTPQQQQQHGIQQPNMGGQNAPTNPQQMAAQQVIAQLQQGQNFQNFVMAPGQVGIVGTQGSTIGMPISSNGHQVQPGNQLHLSRGQPGHVMNIMQHQQAGIAQDGMHVQMNPQPQNVAQHAIDQQQTMQAAVPMQDDSGKQPLEFDHAIRYVTKIKKRFQDDTDTYKQFLDILHTYQQHQQPIDEVLGLVSELFKDHADLLQEFTFFLPDSVREQAKQEIARITQQRRKQEKKTSGRRKAKAKAREVERESALEDPLSKIPRLERKLFTRIKNALGTRELWSEFLKCLDLFAQEVLSRMELITLLSDIFVGRDDLLEEFDRLLASRGATENLQEDAWFSMPLQEIDFAQCRRCTPSYRALPVSYPKPPCSERTALCRSVLNDMWVSMPTGSEDFSFMRKNQYEDALFKCEDDRYEIDLVIESNAAAIRRLEPLKKEIDALMSKTGQGGMWRYKLDRRTLSAIHLKSIARVYGDHGTEILELLRKNPAGAIPTILKRLKQKDIEWRQSRLELNKQWKDTMEKNYFKALDHRSFFFKQNEKKLIQARQMMMDIRDKANLKEVKLLEKKQVESTTETKNDNNEDESSFSSIEHPDIELDFDDVTVHQYAWGLIAYAAETQISKEDAERISAFYTHFIHPLLRMPKSWLGKSSALSPEEIAKLPENMKAYAPQESDVPIKRADTYPASTRVVTEYGVGIVEDYDESTGVYEVKLGFGSVFLSPSKVFLDGPYATENESSSKPLTLLDEDFEEASENGPVFYGASTCYYFFRLYHMVYCRIKELKQLCESGQYRAPRHRIKHVLDRANDGSEMETDDECNNFAVVLSLIKSLFENSLESSKFEDELRNLLGASSFFIFTIEKVISATTKQLVSLVSDEKVVESVRAIDAYDSQRNATNMALVYKANRSVLMLQEGCCFRFQYVPGVLKPAEEQPDRDPKPKKPDAHTLPSEFDVGNKIYVKRSAWKVPPKICFELLDTLPSTTELPPGWSTSKSSLPESKNKLVTVEPMQVDITVPENSDNSSKPFLLRTVSKNQGKSESKNGLRMSLVLPLYKLSYVPGSEDVFHCIHEFNESSNDSDARTARFKRWYHEKLEGMELDNDMEVDSKSQKS